MRAVVNHEYGPPTVLQFIDIEKPTPGPGEVLIRVRAVAVTSEESTFRKGDQLKARLGVTGLFRPKHPNLGICLSGEVEAVGENVTRFHKGDEVYGESMHGGANAEYISLPEQETLALKPAGLTHEEAAGISGGALTALPFLRDVGGIQKGQSVLVYGASGSVGTAAVQFARHFGATVTGVCSTANVELVRSLGAQHVIDYTKEDFAKGNEQYDIIFDAVGMSSFSRCRRALKPAGVYLTTVPTFGLLFQMLRTSIVGSRTAKITFTGLRPPAERVKDLDLLHDLVDAGTYRPVIDRTYPFDEIVEAHRYVDSGRKKGNVVVTVAGEAI